MRAHALGAGLLAVLFGCAPPSAGPERSAGAVCTADGDGFAPDRGLGGTGVRVADRGIGGTGAPVRMADRGIGGTGAPIGVRGTVTGFASICVNGLEIAYAQTDKVDIDGIELEARELRVGQVVTLRADPAPGALVAADLSVRHAVSGPIEAVENGGMNLIVAGQSVLMGAGSPGADLLRPGDWLEVSGLRDPAGYIVAARADVRGPGQVVISGKLAGRAGALRIGGARLAGVVPAEINSGVTVAGDYADGVLTVRRVISAGDTLSGAGRGVIYIEAYAKSGGGQTLQIGDDLTAEIASSFGKLPDRSTLLVLALQHAETGGLVAVAQFDGHGNSSGGTTPVATTVAAAIAPHATTTTAISTSTTASATAGAKAAASTAATNAAKAAATTSAKSAAASTATSTSKGSTSATSGASSSGGKGASATGKDTAGNSSAAGGSAAPTKK